MEKNDKSEKGSEKNFKIGDMVVYPGQGVGKITGIDHKEVAGQRQSFYILEISKTDTKILIPLTRLNKANLRNVVDSATVRQVYGVLKEKSAYGDSTTWNRRYREYMEKIKSGDILKLAAVLRDLSRLKQDKDLSFGERKMLDTVSTLLVTELSLAESCSEEDIKAKFNKLFSKGRPAVDLRKDDDDEEEDQEEEESEEEDDD